jgi:hypothetical protein
MTANVKIRLLAAERSKRESMEIAAGRKSAEPERRANISTTDTACKLLSAIGEECL